jgi:hypothetical protein
MRTFAFIAFWTSGRAENNGQNGMFCPAIQSSGQRSGRSPAWLYPLPDFSRIPFLSFF